MDVKFLLGRLGLICLAASLSFPVFAAERAALTPTAVTAKTAATPSAKPLNINTADATTLTEAHLKGIGKKRAEAIVAYREQHGAFKSLDDLKNIKGLSQKIIDDNRSKLSLN